MSSGHEVISAFLDDEPFAPQDLARALDDPAGAAPAGRTALRPRRPWRAVAAAAGLFLALAGGYVAGGRHAVTTSSEAPTPTRVVEAVQFVPGGGMR